MSGTQEILWNDFLAYAGLRVDEKPAKTDPWIGINTGKSIPSNFPGGAPTVLPEGQLGVTGVRTGSPAAAAGLDIGDVLVALNGQQVNPTNFADVLKSQKPGTEIPVTFFRRDQLQTVQINVVADPTLAYEIKEVADPTPSQKEILSSWLGQGK